MNKSKIEDLYDNMQDKIVQDEMIQKEMINLINRVKETHLKDKHKEQLKNCMDGILKWYEVLEEVD